MDLILPVSIIATISLIVIAVVIYRRQLVDKRAAFIDSYRFPESIANKVSETYQHLSDKQVEQVIHGLREYFHVIALSNKKMVSMPSQAIDVAWHEFILFTREYSIFCQKALGRFLHHTPAEAMKSRSEAQMGIKRAWKIACQREQIDPLAPKSLPLLFALDANLQIEDGFHYQLDCMKSSAKNNTDGGSAFSENFCGSHIKCSSGCGGSSGDSTGGCSGDGGGCGGS